MTLIKNTKYKKEAKEFNNIEIVNIQEKNIMYGPIFPNYGDDLELLHYRNREYPQVKPASIKTSSTPIIEAPLFWCGALNIHFGHFIVECISRILPYKELKIKGKLCFSVMPNECIPSFFWEVIDFFGYSKTDVLLVDDVIIAKKLLVAPQNESLNQNEPTSEFYLDLLDKNSPPVPYDKRTGGVYYFSRTQLDKYTGKLAGELYIEKYLKACGVNIIYPEQLTVYEQVEIFKNADLIIMVESSAFHTLQLLGKTDCDLFIIKRRPNSSVNNPLRLRCNVKMNHTSYNSFEAGLNGAGVVKENWGICIYPIDLIKEITTDIIKYDFPIKEQQISEKEYNEIVENDIADFRAKQT